MNLQRCRACNNPAVFKIDRKLYCAVHRPPIGRPVVPADVIDARKSLADGYDIKTTAKDLGLMAADLDAALWNHFGKPMTEEDAPRRYRPEFVA